MPIEFFEHSSISINWKHSRITKRNIKQIEYKKSNEILRIWPYLPNLHLKPKNNKIRPDENLQTFLNLWFLLQLCSSALELASILPSDPGRQHREPGPLFDLLFQEPVSFFCDIHGVGGEFGGAGIDEAGYGGGGQLGRGVLGENQESWFGKVGRSSGGRGGGKERQSKKWKGAIGKLARNLGKN